MSHHQGREDLLKHDLIALLLVPGFYNKPKITFIINSELTVKGRTRIATLMDDAPSEAAMLSVESSFFQHPYYRARMS